MAEHKNCLECGTDFEAKRKDKVFCTDLCRANYRHKHPKPSLNGGDQSTIEFKNETQVETTMNNLPSRNERKEIDKPVKRVEFNVPSDTGVQIQYVITALTRDRDRFEKQYDDEKQETKKLKGANEKLEKELLQVKHDHEIEALKTENEKGSGLQGFGESPAGIKLIETFGPVLAGPLGKLMEKWADQQPAPAAPQQLGEATGNANAVAFINWINKQSEPAQRAVFSLLQGLSKQPDENNLLATIAQIQNLVMGDFMRTAV